MITYTINKSILWLEDKAGGDCKEYFSELYEEDVTLITSIEEALDIFECSLAFVDLIVLDIDFKNGINSSEQSIIERLNQNGVLIIGNKSLVENAGYYLFLYLLRKGFPVDRICILSGNTGKNGTNTSGEWEDEVFKFAGLKAPITYPKLKNKIGYSDLEKTGKPINRNKEFLKWLNGKSTEYFKIRRCVIALCNIIKNYLENGQDVEKILIMKNEHGRGLGKKYFIDMLSSLMNLPMLYKENNIGDKCSEEEQKVFYHILSQITHDWEAIKFIKDDTKDNYANKSTMKLLRNWIAHSRLLEDKLDYKFTASLFGIGMRALFDVEKDPKLEEEYCDIEEKLIDIFDSCNQYTNSEISSAIEKSNMDFLDKLPNVGNLPIKLGNTLGLIQFLGGDKNDNPIKCKYAYILRYFGHCILKIKFSPFYYKYDKGKTICYTSFDTHVIVEKENDTIGNRYLKASLDLWK